ncbi:hypothetical protein D3C85_1839190 [compost metagenome]
MLVTLAAGKSAAVEKFQHLNGQFTPHAEPVTKIGGVGTALRFIQFTDQRGELFYPLA